MTLLIASFLFAETVTVSWNANTESDLYGYRIHFGTKSGEYSSEIDVVGGDTAFVGIRLVSGMQYFFAVTAFDTAGNESSFSKEAIFPDNRPPNIWDIVFLKDSLKEIFLEIEAHEDETIDETGWTIFGHANREITDSGIYILNPELFNITVIFRAKLIGNGSCLDEPKRIWIEETVWSISVDFSEIEFSSSNERIFINFFDDCWILGESDANIRIENIKIFK